MLVLIKMKLLVFLVLSRYELACKYRIISQIPNIIWSRIEFCDISGVDFHFFKIKLQHIAYLNLFQKVRLFVTWWIVLSSDNNLTQNIIRGQLKYKKEMNQDKILTHSLLLLRNELIKKNLTIMFEIWKH